MKKIRFVTATQTNKKDFLANKPLGLFLEKTGYLKNSTIIENNKDGLSKIYNKFLTEEYKKEYVIFLHDDVLIEDLFFEEKIQLAFEKYDIIGLAGAKNCDLSVEKCAWHLMTSPQNYVGEVAHSKNKKAWTTVFGSTDQRALLLDGLFIGVNVEMALSKNLKWDENFDFHHYDIAFCLNANTLKIKAGVFPLRVVHYGLGDSMLSESWENSNSKFKKIYSNA
jgi:hypothetical protein